ncbi:2-succinyl-6-hydroxy-2,4-cyclohexadiene-1-carboxylate synthase [Endozoicomonas sp.]|uniref:2-succinyl-6-hydroxy-2, 4-cyclohexadiene-1-carboxylate synthase n=1 Tax=Endozoicomonas sp. TaxID=1892382 RepID=UPI00383AC1AF
MNLSYHCSGAIGAPVLFLLHGFLGSADDWQPLIQALGSDYCLIAVDLPGHGSSYWEKEDAQGADYFCHRLEQTIQAIEQEQNLNLTRFSLLGYSLGGRLAMAYAIAFPDRIEQLILEGAHPGLVNEQEKECRYQSDLEWARRFNQEPVAEVLRDWYKQPVFSDLTEDQVTSLISQRIEGRSQGSGQLLAEALMGFSLSRQPDYRQAMLQIAAQVHYFHGENDQKFGQLGQQLLAEKVINSVQPIARCGHNIHREQPEAMAGLLRKLSGVRYE